MSNSGSDKKNKKAAQLKPVSLDFHHEVNRANHHTHDYATKRLVVRRGQAFELTATFDRAFDDKRDAVVLQFTTGRNPHQSKKSLIRVHEVDNLSTSGWEMKRYKSSGRTIQLKVVPPADAIVGEYTVFLETKMKEKQSSQLLSTPPEKLFILFNPWCKDDAVYMEDEAHRNEYVLDDHGRIWQGNARYPQSQPWNFGQFEDVSLETSLVLLDKKGLATFKRADPVLVSRVISQLVNCNDRDGGILEGRWSATYPPDTTNPAEWTGSVAILKEYQDQSGCSVKYGQCWVYSGLVTTLLRALGIPARSVTNFESAHDTDSSMTIDFHFDENLNPLEGENDSIWNFHVWNEAYFTRPDLPDGYDGWQAVDATPQERSDGLFQCGPCPVKAIKNGEVFLPYDAKFVFAEVNGDKFYWWPNPKDKENMVPIGVDKRCVGKMISTKAVGKDDREDLTLEYKHPEGSFEERKAIRLAYKYSSRKEGDLDRISQSNDDVVFKAKIREQVFVGKDVEVKLEMKNTVKEDRSVKLTIIAKAASYNDRGAEELKRLSKIVTLNGGEESFEVLRILEEDYLKMPPGLKIKIYLIALVNQTQQTFFHQEWVDLLKPRLFTDGIRQKVKKGEMFEKTFYFTNPLSVKLTNGVLRVETSRMEPPTQTIKVGEPVAPGTKASMAVILTPQAKGERYVGASFHSDQLSGVWGEFQVLVFDD